MGWSIRFLAALAATIACAQASRAGTLRGVVIAEDGTPAAKAHIWVAKLWTHHLERLEATADDQGQFAIEVTPARWFIEATLGQQGGTSTEQVVVVEGSEPTAVTIRLKAWGRLRGRLVEADTGQPIEGGRLVIDNGLDPVTDQDGRFEVSGLSRGRYHESFVVARGRERKRVLFEMAEGGTTDLEIPVSRGAKAVGRVLDVEGNPIAGASVGRSTSGSYLSLTGLWVRADDRGRFELDGLPLDRTIWLNAEAEGFEGAQRDGVQANPDGTPIAIEFRLARNPAARNSPTGAKVASTKQDAPKVEGRRNLAGLVTDPAGKPAPGAAVRWGADRSSESIETKTDSEGRFRLALVPDRPEIVCVTPAQSDLAPELSSVEKGGDQEIRVMLSKGHTTSGTVHDDRGSPFAGVTVVPMIPGVGRTRQGMALWERSVKTDARGRFALSGLPSGATNYAFLGEGMSDLRDHPLDLDKENDVTMSAAGAIRGKVVDASGRPVRNFRVLLNGSRRREPGDKFGGFFAGFCGIGLSFTADDGSFLVRNLDAGSVQRVTVVSTGFGEGTIDRVIAEPLNQVTADKTPIFRLGAAHVLQIRVVEDGTKRPVQAARVSLIYDDPSIDDNFAWGYHDTAWGDSVHARTDAAGVATFSPLTFGEGTITVQAPGFARQHFGWRNGTRDLAVVLKPEAIVAGELIDDSTGRPLEGGIVRMSSPQFGHIAASLQSTDGGRFRIGELAEGTYSFSIASDDNGNLYQETMTLKAGQQVSRSLRPSPVKAAIAQAMRRLAAPKVPTTQLFKVGDAAPEFTTRTLEGKPLNLGDYRGKFVLLDFWATWCGPCVAEIPELQAVHEAFGQDARFAMISLSLDPSEADVKKFLMQRKQPWTQAFLGDWSKDEVTKKYGIELIPTILLLDPEGKIIARDLRGKGIKEAVAKALEGH